MPIAVPVSESWACSTPAVPTASGHVLQNTGFAAIAADRSSPSAPTAAIISIRILAIVPNAAIFAAEAAKGYYKVRKRYG